MITRKELLLKLDNLNNLLDKLSSEKTNHPYRQLRYWNRINGPECRYIQQTALASNIKDFEPALKDLVDGYSQYRSEHPTEFT